MLCVSMNEIQEGWKVVSFREVVMSTGNCRDSILCESCSTLQVRMSQVWFAQCTDPFISVSGRKVLFETGNLLAKQCSKTGSG